jgi:hypothetical protein
MFVTVFICCDQTDLLLCILVPISEMDYVQSSFQFTVRVIRLQMDLQHYIFLRIHVTKISMYVLYICYTHTHRHTDLSGKCCFGCVI